MKKLADMGVRFKLMITFTLVSLPPLLATAFFFYYTSSGIVEKELGAHTIEVARQVDQQLSAFNNDLDQLYDMVQNNNDVQNFLSFRQETNDTFEIGTVFNIRKFLSNIRTSRVGMKGIFIVNNTGRSVFDSNGLAQYYYNFPNDPWFRKLQSSSKERQLLPVHPETYIDNEPVITYAGKLSNYVNFMGGTLLIDFNAGYLTQMNANIQLGQSGYVFMLSPDGTPVVPDSRYPSDMIQNPTFRQFLQEKEGYFVTDYKGEETLVGFSTSARTGWKIVGIVPLSELAQGIRHIRTSLYLIAPLMALLVIGISFYLSRQITKPLLRLETTMKVVEKGDFTPSVPFERRDELGRLTKSFNQMVKRLKQLQEEVYLSEIRETKLELLNREAELRALQAQINPHFLYNTLNTMRCVGDVYEVEPVSEMSEALAQMFKYSIEGGKYTLLAEELSHVHAFVKIIQIRYPDTIQCHFDIPASLTNTVVLKLLLQPLVENAVTHGLIPKGTCGNIWVIAIERGDQLILRVVDDGVGMSQEAVDGWKGRIRSESEDSGLPGKHLGLTNVAHRLALTYGSEGQLRMESGLGRGTIVEINLPLEHEDGGGIHV